MKFLFIVKQKKNMDTFEGVVAALLKDGHRVTVAIQQRDEDRDRRLADQFDNPGFELAACPEGRGDGWRASAPLVRSVRDWVQYFRSPYKQASKLRQRAADRLLKELGASGRVDADALTLTSAAVTRLQEALDQFERAIPSDSLHEEFLARHQPDVVLVTPGLHFGSGQTDFIKSARMRGIPVWMLLFSWDNLSTKGALHAAPDLMFVWNERQRQEALELHDFPSDRVVIAGAPRFDEFFRLRSVISRQDFVAPLGLSVDKPTLLYMCSSRFIAERELAFIRKWLVAIRSSNSALQRCNVVVRPHPDIALVSDEEPLTVTWPGMPQVTGWVQRPFDDPAAIVLRTTYRTQQAFFECLHHSDAVVALNTSAELEAGIAGRPVFTVLATEDGADGQSNTLHFNYLLQDHGGFVTYAADLQTHVEQLANAVAAPPRAGEIRKFIMEFLRPLGDRPVADLLARTLVERYEQPSAVSLPVQAKASDAPAHLEPIDATEKAQKVLALGEAESGLKVLATAETRRWRRRGVLLLDPSIVQWLNERVRPGDVMYDIGASVGAYSILAAAQRGALAVAFEPGFSSFKTLCNNLLLNGCSRSVVPLPFALGDRAGLLELEYPHDPGDDLHSLRARDWRPRRDPIESQYAQPVCADRLDDLVLRHRLPAPNVIRLAVRNGADAVLRGAARLLRSNHLRSLHVSVRDESQAELVAQTFGGSGLSATIGSVKGDYGIAVLVERTSAPSLLDTPTEVFHRAANRLRRLW